MVDELIPPWEVPELFGSPKLNSVCCPADNIINTIIDSGWFRSDQTFINGFTGDKLSLEVFERALHLNFIQVAHYQNEGRGSEIMQMLCDLLDKYKTVCYLSICSDWTDYNKLLHFYTKYNFKFYSNDTINMCREPKWRD